MVGGMMAMIVSVIIFLGGLIAFTCNVIEKLPTQEVATTCYVDRKIDAVKVTNPIPFKKWQGYFFEGKAKEDADIIDSRKDEVKVKCQGVTGWRQHNDGPKQETYGEVYKWIPKKDFHYYYTTEELSEIVNKTKKK